MTERYDNHTLWENYAQNYTGFCIEYCFRDLDGREFDDYESLVYMLPITYRREKPYFDIVRFMDGAYRQFVYKDASWQRDPELDADLNMHTLNCLSRMVVVIQARKLFWMRCMKKVLFLPIHFPKMLSAHIFPI